MRSAMFSGCHDPNQRNRDETEDHDEDESPEIISRPVKDHTAHIGAQSRTDTKDTLKGSVDPSEIPSLIEVGCNGHEEGSSGTPSGTEKGGEKVKEGCGADGFEEEKK